jgi:hypothetical protein
MAFSKARTPIRLGSLGAGRTVREIGKGNLDHLTDLLGCQSAATLY